MLLLLLKRAKQTEIMYNFRPSFRMLFRSMKELKESGMHFNEISYWIFLKKIIEFRFLENVTGQGP